LIVHEGQQVVAAREVVAEMTIFLVMVEEFDEAKTAEQVSRAPTAASTG
jgi:hypothetical protein